MIPIELIALGYVVWATSILVLCFKFFEEWRKEEPVHWRRWGSPSLVGVGYLIWAFLLGNEACKIGNKNMLASVQKLRAVMMLGVVFSIVLFLWEVATK